MYADICFLKTGLDLSEAEQLQRTEDADRPQLPHLENSRKADGGSTSLKLKAVRDARRRARAQTLTQKNR